MAGFLSRFRDAFLTKQIMLNGLYLRLVWREHYTLSLSLFSIFRENISASVKNHWWVTIDSTPDLKFKTYIKIWNISITHRLLPKSWTTNNIDFRKLSDKKNMFITKA